MGEQRVEILAVSLYGAVTRRPPLPATWNANVGYAPSEVTTDVPGSTCRRATTPNSASMPSPTTTWAGVTPCRAAIACLRSWFSGSPYIHPSAAAACIAATADGAAPNALSLAPSRARNGRPRRRSSVSGPTNGTLAGRPSTIVVSGAVWARLLGHAR